MKKKQDKHLVSGIYCPKLKRIMRITAFFLICCALYVSAETYSQTKVFSFTMKNASIEEVLSVIKKIANTPSSMRIPKSTSAPKYQFPLRKKLFQVF